MKTSTLVSGIVGGIVLWVLGFLFYGMANATAGYATPEGIAASRGDDIDMLWLTLGHIVFGIGASMLYGKWARGTHNLRHGLEFGLILGIVTGIGLNMIWFSTANFMAGMGHVVDGLFSVVASGIMGACIAFVYGKMDSGD
jgi:hypothetical protein